jgi:hypothetical protein
MKKFLIFALCFPLIFASCGSSVTNAATGFWQSPTTTSGYVWLRLNDNGGVISGSLGTSNSSGSLPITGNRSGNQLSVNYYSTSGSFSFSGPVNGDLFDAFTQICTTSCSSGQIRFTRTSMSSASENNSQTRTRNTAALESLSQTVLDSLLH